jgi:cytochrome c biogenesis protein CcmG/thiol:disulfide interchange protein DsbE
MGILVWAKKWLPLGAFIAVLVLFAWRLGVRLHQVSASMINKPLPVFYAYDLQRLSHVYDRSAFLGKVTILHVWSSWCRDCEQDNRLLLSHSADKRVRIMGVNYIDDREEALDWLSVYGNPYKGIIFDSTGRLARRLGVYATPETYLIDRKGIIRYKVVGNLTRDLWERKLEPLISRYKE